MKAGLLTGQLCPKSIHRRIVGQQMKLFSFVPSFPPPPVLLALSICVSPPLRPWANLLPFAWIALSAPFPLSYPLPFLAIIFFFAPSRLSVFALIFFPLRGSPSQRLSLYPIPCPSLRSFFSLRLRVSAALRLSFTLCVDRPLSAFPFILSPALPIGHFFFAPSRLSVFALIFFPLRGLPSQRLSL